MSAIVSPSMPLVPRADIRPDTESSARVHGATAASVEPLPELVERGEPGGSTHACEERYHSLLENIDAAIVTIDADDIVTYASPSVMRLTGIPAATIVGRPYTDFVPADEVPRLALSREQVLEGQPQVVEFRLLRTDGSWRWLRAQARPVLQSGRAFAGNVVVTDITEQRRIEDALRESEARWRSLVHSAPDMVFLVDHAGCIQYVNHVPQGADVGTATLIGRRAAEMVVPEHRERVASSLGMVLSSGQSASYEVCVRRSTGAEIWYSMRAAPVRQGERVVAAMLIARDISEQKLVEEAKDGLIRDVAHELRTPLAKAQMSLELLLETSGKQSVDIQAVNRLGRIAFDSIRRLVHTLEATLELSTLEARARGRRREPVELGDLARAAARDVEPQAAARRLSLAVNIPEGLPAVMGDRDDLARVIHNLLDNAVKFTQEGGILITAVRRCGELEMTVTDTGQGIRSENLDKVFGRFYQEKTRFAGVGVGLTICRRIVEAHGGRIWAESAGQDQGSAIHFTLPFASQSGGGDQQCRATF